MRIFILMTKKGGQITCISSLAGVSGTNKGITYRTDTMGDITATGGGSDPRGTGASLLKDIINIYRPGPGS